MNLDLNLWELLGIPPLTALAVVISTTALYVAFAGLLSVGSQRLFSSPSALDTAVAGVLGAVVGRTMLGPFPTLGAGLVALATLVALELTLGRIRLRAFSNPARQHGVALVVGGVVRYDRLHDFQLDEVWLWQLLRTRGVGDLTQVQLMVIERSGDISLIETGHAVTDRALVGVQDAEAVRAELEISG